jgi:tetratricopeptide (TPR) repeat protein
MNDELDEPLPPLDRPGVAPLWRLVAVFGLLAGAALLCMVIVLLVALAQQGRQSFVNNMPMAAPPMAFAGGAAVAADDAFDDANPPYPRKQDLRPAGTFPLPGDGEAPAGRAAVPPRREFLQAAARVVWTSAEPEAPDRVLVSPDGANMAYVSGNTLMAGGIGMPQPVGQNNQFIRPAPPFAGPMGAMPAPGGMGAPAQPPHNGPGPHAVLCGWSVDGPVVTWVNDVGQVWQHDMRMPNNQTTHFTNVETAIPLSGEPQRLVLVRRLTRMKVDAPGSRPARDLTEVVVSPPRDAVQNPALVPAGPARWHSPALSPDGKRLALVSDRDQEPGRWRVFVLALDGPGPEPVRPVSPPAARVEGVCWAPDGKALVYARSESPPPADHLSGTPRDACDLYLLDLETKKETRLSRGGGFTSPSVTNDGELFFLAETHQEGAAPAVELVEMKLQAARDFVADQEKLARDRARAWAELADAALKDAGVAANADGAALTAEAMKKIADAFQKDFAAKLKADPPEDRAALDRLRSEVSALDLAPPEQALLVLLFGVVEGEYLRGQQGRSAWHLGPGPLVAAAPVRGENPFGYAFNPFRPLRARDGADKKGGPQSLAEVLYRAEGRPLVLSNDPAAARAALDKLVDADLARGNALLKGGKGDEADRVLLGLTKRHAGNHFLTVQVAALLHEHGRTKALADLLQPLLAQVDVMGAALPRDARLYNLLGVAALEGDTNRAIQAFQNALRCDLKYGPAYLNLAQAYQKASRLADARWCLRRYLKLFPEGELADDARRRLTVAGDVNGPAAGGAAAGGGGP